MATLFDLIEASRDGESLAEIEGRCRGYEAALKNHGVHEAGSGFEDRFRRYLRDRHGLDTSRGWARAIEADLKPGESGLQRLRTLLQNFKDSGAAP